MPLYSNILLSGTDAKSDAKTVPVSVNNQTSTKTTSASMRFLQDHLMSKKRSKQTSQQPVKILKQTDRSLINEESCPIKYSEFDWDLNDEYDPMMPNSYELLQLERIKIEEQQRLGKKVSQKIDLSLLDALDKFDDDDEVPVMGRGIAIAPPPTLNTSVSDTLKGSAIQNLSTKNIHPGQPPDEVGKLDGISAAAKIMAKMGYKVGQGLGKDKQGMSTPLEFEATGASVARIVQAVKTGATDADNDTDLNATRVLLLQNMVGPGEVDDELEAETKEECKKYGEVVKCLIYEIPNKQVPDDEAVRIFVEFKDEASSRRAVGDLNGRYFGGRVVRASFYDPNKFAKYILAP